MKEVIKIYKEWNSLSTYRTVLYGIAAISILIYHYCSIYSYYPGAVRPQWANFYYNFWGSVGVEIFLFLSGVFLYHSYQKTENFFEFIKKRIYRVIIPYALVGSVFWITEYIVIKDGTIFDLIQDFAFVTFFTKGEGRFWYVCAIMIFYLLYPMIYRFLFFNSRKPIYNFIILETISILLILVIKDFPIYNRIQIALTRFPVFILGCFYGKKVFEKASISTLELICSLMGIAIKLMMTNFHINMIALRIISSLFAFSICVLSNLLLQNICRKKEFKFNVLTFFGDRSLEFYLTNVALIKLFIDLKLRAINPVIYILILAFGIMLSFLIPIILQSITLVLRKIKYTENVYLTIIFFGVLIIRTILNIDLKTITVPSDEFNTVSVAAQLAGFDWSKASTSSGYYGYTAILSYIPLFFIRKLVNNSFLLYQAILLVNSIMIALYAIILYKILLRLCEEYFTKKQVAIMALIGVFIPQLFGIGQLTQNESTYSLNHILIIYLVLLNIDTDKKWKKWFYTFLCAVCSVLSFAGNNRGIVIIITLFITIILVRLIYKKWILTPSVFGISLTSLLMVHYQFLYPYFKGFFPAETYNTDANIIFERLPRILTNWADVKACIVALVGWVYTFIVSTYGIGLLLIVILLFFMIDLVRKSTQNLFEENVLNIVQILWLLGTTSLCIINFLDSYQGILQYNLDISHNPTRVDKLFYFRYYIALAPFSVSYSILQMKKGSYYKSKKFGEVASGAFFAISLLFHGYVAIQLHGLSYAPSSTNFIGLFLGRWTSNYKYGIVQSGRFIYCTLISAVIILSIFYLFKKGKYTEWLSMFLLVELITCIIYSGYYMGPRTQVWKNYINSEIVDFFADNEFEDVYVDNKGKVFLYQFALPNISVCCEFDSQDAVICEKGTLNQDPVMEEYEILPIDSNTSIWIRKTCYPKIYLDYFED